MSRCLINTMWAGDERNRKGVGWREWILKWKGILIISPHTAARALYRVSIMMAPISCIPFATPFNAQSTSIKRLRLTTPSLTTAHLRLHGHYCSFYELGREMREMGGGWWRSGGGAEEEEGEYLEMLFSSPLLPDRAERTHPETCDECRETAMMESPVTVQIDMLIHESRQSVQLDHFISSVQLCDIDGRHINTKKKETNAYKRGMWNYNHKLERTQCLEHSTEVCTVAEAGALVRDYV